MTQFDVESVSNFISALDTQYEQFRDAGAGLQRVSLRKVGDKIEITIIGTGQSLIADTAALLQATSLIRSAWSRRISRVIMNSGGFGTVDLVVSTAGKRVKAFWTVSSTEHDYR
ncbi:MAG UNVERIFIED_CONTAM: hypothetical protein LVR18_29900 [Planctomycetaceae bacterium]|jgi:hypothetical protein